MLARSDNSRDVARQVRIHADVIRVRRMARPVPALRDNTKWINRRIKRILYYAKGLSRMSGGCVVHIIRLLD